MSRPAPTLAAHPPGRSMTLSEHLRELRHRVLVCLGALTVGAVAVFVVFDHVLAMLLHPYCAARGPHHPCNLYVTGPLDGLSVRVEVAAYGGAVLASPVVLFHLWRFVTPGLHPRERRYTWPFVVVSACLFAAGAGVALAVLPHALSWLAGVGGPSLRQLYSPSSYLGLLVLMMAAFGVAFELPVVLVFLQLAHVVTADRLAGWRRPAVVVLVALAAVITPSSDPFSMLALAVPLVAFYELSIHTGRFLTTPRRRGNRPGARGRSSDGQLSS
jgi:sec-independent protein translocase protein TatC